jgi:hypothetical protein
MPIYPVLTQHCSIGSMIPVGLRTLQAGQPLRPLGRDSYSWYETQPVPSQSRLPAAFLRLALHRSDLKDRVTECLTFKSLEGRVFPGIEV